MAEEDKARRWTLIKPRQGGPVAVQPASPNAYFKLAEQVEVAEVSKLREEWEAELLSDEAVKAAASATYATRYPSDHAKIKATLRAAALAAAKEHHAHP